MTDMIFLIGGIFFLGDWLMIVVMTVAYFALPQRILPDTYKHEYVKFFLLFLSIYFLSFFILEKVIHSIDDTRLFFKMFGFPALLLSHWLYKFKTVQKSRNLTFFLFFATLYFTGGIIAMRLLM